MFSTIMVEELKAASSLAHLTPHLCSYKSEVIHFWWGFQDALFGFLGISGCSGPLCCTLSMFRVAPAACQGFFLRLLLFLPSPFVSPQPHSALSRGTAKVMDLLEMGNDVSCPREQQEGRARRESNLSHPFLWPHSLKPIFLPSQRSGRKEAAPVRMFRIKPLLQFH